MAKIKSAEKRARQSQEQRVRNRATRSVVGTERGKAFAAVAAGDKDVATKAASRYASVLDKAVKNQGMDPLAERAIVAA